MFTNNHRDAILNVLRATTYTSFTGYAGLITAITNWRSGTVTEASYTGYGTRPSITFSAPADTSPAGGREIGNSAIVTFPQNTGSNQDVIGWGVWDASTAGNLKAIGLLDTDSPILGTATVADTITAPAHGLEAGQRVFVLAAPGAVIPTGLSENTAYYVTTANLATDSFQLSTTGAGGAAVDITASGAALFIPYKAVTIATNATPEFAASALKIQI